MHDLYICDCYVMYMYVIMLCDNLYMTLHTLHYIFNNMEKDITQIIITNLSYSHYSHLI